MATIASSATSVLIAHVAAHTAHDPPRRRRDHAAEPLAARHRRAVRHAGRRCTPAASTSASAGRRAATRSPCGRCAATRPSPDRSPQDVLELQGYLARRDPDPGRRTPSPGRGTDVPLYILGSSLFGAKLAAVLGLPYAFASHFAPQALEQAVATYRARVPPVRRSSTAPYVIAGVNVIAADTDDRGRRAAAAASAGARVSLFLGAGRSFTDEEADAILASPQGRQIAEMMRYTAVGTPELVRALPRGVRRARRRRRAHRRPRRTDARGPPALARPARRRVGARARHGGGHRCSPGCSGRPGPAAGYDGAQ